MNWNVKNNGYKKISELTHGDALYVTREDIDHICKLTIDEVTIDVNSYFIRATNIQNMRMPIKDANTSVYKISHNDFACSTNLNEILKLHPEYSVVDYESKHIGE
jgi:hypothetical protein